MEIRRATRADLDTVISWIPDARVCQWWAGPGVRFPMSVSSLAEDIDFLTHPSYCGVDREGILGFGQWVVKTVHQLHMTRIVIRPNRRECGEGLRFCRALIRIAGDMGARGLTLNVYRNHRRAMGLYQALGFREADVHPDGDVCRMEMSLSTGDYGSTA